MVLLQHLHDVPNLREYVFTVIRNLFLGGDIALMDHSVSKFDLRLTEIIQNQCPFGRVKSS